MAARANFNRNQARQLVEKIAEDHGHIPADMWSTLPPEVRDYFQERWRAKDNQLAASIFTLARNLYSSSARFIFELFQNADDNQYTEAQLAGEDPCVSFLMYHDKLVVECNEDGFTEDNIRAISDIGKSSKQGAQGYIGEKGIGFKSTFMAAWKVQIQSGPFSFYFQHREGDSGIGMITPIWFEPETDLPWPMTRTTLYFHDNGNPGNLQTRRDGIIKQIFDLQGTALLFLQNLQRINIVLFDENGQTIRSKQTTMVKSDRDGMIRLRTIESRGIISTQRMTQFYVASHTAINLAKNENRTYTEAEDEAKAYATARVCVAFPMCDNDEPIIGAQELFAFMPVRKVGFNFLIHSDFVTQANRQDIVMTSARNIGLRQAVGDTFAKAIQEICKRPGLRYKWMRYLPCYNSLPLDNFWKELVSQLNQKLSNMRILYSRDEALDRQYKIGSLYRLSSKHLDQVGNPLLPDLPTARYISAKYSTADLEILSEYGLRYLHTENIMERLESFISQPSWRAIVYQYRDEDWHSRMAKLIMMIWDDRQSDWKGKLRNLPLLPLSCGVFRSSPKLSAGSIYFPDIDGTPVPQDIDINMILPAAAANPDCRRLYTALGVEKVTPAMVRNLIVSKHLSWVTTGLDVTMGNNHLRYLYQMEVKDPISPNEQDIIVVFDQKERARHAKVECVYMPGEGDWSPGNVLKAPENTEPEELDVSFVHPLYLQDEPKPPNGCDRNWKDWLYHIIWLETMVLIFTTRSPRLNDPNLALSKEWLFVTKHRSDMMISRLQARWPETGNLWEQDQIGSKLIRELEVLCLNGERHTLQGTFLPLPSLLARCEHFLNNINAAPFVKLSCSLEDSDAPHWVGMGKNFGIGVTDDLELSLAILGAIISNNSATRGALTQTVLELYLRLYAQCIASESKDESQEKVRKFCIENRGVLCPNASGDHTLAGMDWQSPTKCLWDAPAGFTSMRPIRRIWEPTMMALSLQDRANLEQFFRHTLLIGNLTSGHIMEELRDISELCEKDSTYSPAPGFLHDMYRKLHALKDEMDESLSLALKETFKDENLIYASSGQSKQWFKILECVWSSEGTMLGKPSLEPLYPDLAELFVDYFGVPKLNFALAYQQLVEVGSTVPTIAYAKNLLWSLAALLAADNESRPSFGDEASLCRVFPVKLPDGSTRLLSAIDNFAIVDRQHYALYLKDKIKVLDFSMDEVRRLKPFIKWTGLTDRYLSRLVAERTVVEDDLCAMDRPLTRNLVGKAGAFVSIAMHFDSPLAHAKPENLHSTLRKTRVFVAQAITSTLEFQQDGQPIIIPINDCELHIEAPHSGGVDIYIPSDENARNFCVASRLPHCLSAHLMNCKPSRVDPQMVGLIASIIHAKPANINRILETNGIIELDLPFQDEDIIEIDDEPVFVPGQGALPRLELGHPSTPVMPADRIANRGGHSPLRGANGSSSSPSRFQQQQDDKYRRLLIQVVNEARRLGLPHQNSTVMPNIVPGQMSYWFWPDVRDRAILREMVGAAGELFVFELLSSLRPALPRFDRSCWRSRARRHAKTHPDYATLEPWDGDETGNSDIFYNDESRVLTHALIELEYLDKSWRNEKPNYHIEVKTTMKDSFEEPFYLSKAQYARMQSLSSGETISSDDGRNPYQKKEVYALFRVYGLKSGHVNVKIYIDPEAARKDGCLEFEVESWSVTPRMKPADQTQARA